MHGNRDTKVGDTQQAPDGKLYYYDGLNYVLPLIFHYRNWSNKTSERIVLPISTFYGVTEYHNQPQWFLKCLDLNKKEYRDFAIRDIITIY